MAQEVHWSRADKEEIAQPVGWVERSDTHQIAIDALMGIAALHPSYVYATSIIEEIMPVTALNHYNLRAPQPLLDAIRDFYCDVVSLKVGARPPFDSVGYWLYAGADPILHLVVARADEKRGAGEYGTFDHVAFTCQGRREMEMHLRARGVAFRVAEVPGAGQVQFFLKDPAGNGVELNFSTSDA